MYDSIAIEYHTLTTLRLDKVSLGMGLECLSILYYNYTYRINMSYQVLGL